MHARTLLALAVAATALAVAPAAQAGIDCDLQPTAPICNRDGGTPPKPPTGGGGGSSHDPYYWTTSRSDQVGDGQFMQTSMTIDRLYGTMSGSTRVWTTNWFWGFHGCVQFDFLDAAGNSISGLSPARCFGVDGTAIGISDRTIPMSFHLHAAEIDRVANLRIVHTKA